MIVTQQFLFTFMHLADALIEGIHMTSQLAGVTVVTNTEWQKD